MVVSRLALALLLLWAPAAMAVCELECVVARDHQATSESSHGDDTGNCHGQPTETEACRCVVVDQAKGSTTSADAVAAPTLAVLPAAVVLSYGRPSACRPPGRHATRLPAPFAQRTRPLLI